MSQNLSLHSPRKFPLMTRTRMLGIRWAKSLAAKKPASVTPAERSTLMARRRTNWPREGLSLMLWQKHLAKRCCGIEYVVEEMKEW